MRTTYEVRGLYCLTCVGRVLEAVAEVPGVRQTRIRYRAEGPSRLSLSTRRLLCAGAVESAVAQAGFTLQRTTPAPHGDSNITSNNNIVGSEWL